MKNKYVFCSIFAGLFLIFTSCNNLFDSEISQNKQNTQSLAGKKVVSLSVNLPQARTIMPTAVTAEDITKVELFQDDKKLDSWNGLSALSDASVTIDYGTYDFTINLYITEGDVFCLVQTGSLRECTVDENTTSLAFTTSYVDKGSLSVTVTLANPNENKIGKIEAGLFTIASDGKTAVTGFDYTELDEFVDLQSVYSLSEVPNGSYYLKLRVYDIDNETVLNTFMDVVKINGYKTEGEVEIDPNNLNSFTSHTSGNIQIDDNILNIIVNTPEKKYLNVCDITFGATTKVGDTVLTESSDVTWNAQLFYGGYNVDDYGTTHIQVTQATEEVPATLSIKKRLEIGGTYQLYVTAVYNGVTSSQTVDLYIPEAEYYEYDVSDKESIGTISKDMSNLIAPAEVKLSGELLDYSNVDSSTVASTTLSSIASAFSNAANYLDVDMAEITVPSSTQAFQFSALGSDDYLFSNSPIASLVLPSSVNTIGASSFYLSSLQKITIPATVIFIEPGTFKDCSSLYEFTVTGETSTGQRVVYSSIHDNLMLLQTATIDGTEKKTLLAVSRSEIPDGENQGEAVTSLDFSDSELSGVSEIAAYACCKNNKLTEIKKFGDITKIGEEAFYYCSSLSSIPKITTPLAEISSRAFYSCQISALEISTDSLVLENSALSCSSLTLSFDITETNYASVKSNIIDNINSVATLVCDGTVYLPDISGAYSVSTPYNSSCFYNCYSSLGSITFNKSAIIGDGQFGAYSNLTTVAFKAGGTIGNYTFYGCSKLPTVELTGVTYFGEKAFYNCNALEGYTGTLGDGAVIGTNAFSSLPKLTSFDLTNVAGISYAAFCNAGLSGTITLPASVIGLSDLALYVNDGNSNNALTLDLTNILSGGTWYYILLSAESAETNWKNWLSSKPDAQTITDAGWTELTEDGTNGTVEAQILSILNQTNTPEGGSAWDYRKYLYKLVD
ncbi:hypothetical protein MSI_02110 [Treponema sp. JC4]|uniref:leucine-rich repeat domain-containing protein n=1 Tax=Treponema sp. JC4 TaxID=1124982 RepID=UPI00025B0D4D|nr:leucine-rich repeat domain-containing protein [Treponema sp. JC4]EID86255.1 hypothetical protein MSI_02110 [Treponema sp. JC4]